MGRFYHCRGMVGNGPMKTEQKTSLELATDFSKGSIYLVDPLNPLVICPECGRRFVAHYRAKVEKFLCKNCGHRCDPDFVHRGKRPVILLQNPVFEFFNTLSVVPVTSQPKARGKIGAVFIPKGKPSGLQKDSWALVWQIRTLNKNLFLKQNYLGKVPSDALEEIDASLRKHLLL